MRLENWFLFKNNSIFKLSETKLEENNLFCKENQLLATGVKTKKELNFIKGLIWSEHGCGKPRTLILIIIHSRLKSLEDFLKQRKMAVMDYGSPLYNELTLWGTIKSNIQKNWLKNKTISGMLTGIGLTQIKDH